MDELRLPGTYADLDGAVPVVWEIGSAQRAGRAGWFELAATIRGIRVSGAGFDSLECDGPSGGLSTNAAGVVEFVLGAGRRSPIVRATLAVGQHTYSNQQEELLEAVLGNLVGQLKPARWESLPDLLAFRLQPRRPEPDGHALPP